ncbi:hypothetical protein SAMN05216274_1025 [Cryobacterium levicorallinum]|uniref:Uncharacterized protein n=1 Tax=Cryobacterium levicorallinum TaxID=995038 RepID=A0ABY1E9T1_9MICO|nr:hypothetical protein SAMN05216274_1025 [Cryobacterium levicorallinum]
MFEARIQTPQADQIGCRNPRPVRRRRSHESTVTYAYSHVHVERENSSGYRPGGFVIRCVKHISGD